MKKLFGKKKIGLALGSGGAKGWAHIGVIRELEKLGIKIDVVSGCSAGALVGAAYTLGKLDEFEEWVKALSLTNMFSYFDLGLNDGGLIKGDKFIKLFSKQVGDTKLEDLKTKFAIVATDLNTGKEACFETGSILDAVRSSIALPGLFSPYTVNDVTYVDGALVNPLPVSICKKMGADIVIAVNVIDVSQNLKEIGKSKSKKSIFEKYFKHNIFAVITDAIDIMQFAITELRIGESKPDILICPKVRNYSIFDFHKGKDLIGLGQDSVKQNLKQIQKLKLS